MSLKVLLIVGGFAKVWIWINFSTLKICGACSRAGMLLEMDPAVLQQLLSDHTMLEAAVQKAQAVLDTSS